MAEIAKRLVAVPVALAGIYLTLVVTSKHRDRTNKYKAAFPFKSFKNDGPFRDASHMLQNNLFTFCKVFLRHWREICWTDTKALRRLRIWFFSSLVNSFFDLKKRWKFGTKINKQNLNEKPVFILGHFRSGTTMLHHMLGRDDHFVYPNTYAAIFPHQYLLIDEVEPEEAGTRGLDNIKMRMSDPQEEAWAAGSYSGVGYELAWAFPAAYEKFGALIASEPNDKKIAKDVAQYKKALKYVHQQVFFQKDPSASKRLLCKSPMHTGKVNFLLDMYPKAQFIFIAREPYRLFRSVCKMAQMAILKSDMTNATDDEIQRCLLFQMKTMFQAYFDAKKNIPKGCLIEIKYEDFCKDKLGYMQQIYKELNLEGWEQMKPKVLEYMEENKEYQRNDFVELAPDLKQIVYEELKFYFDYFKYEK